MKKFIFCGIFASLMISAPVLANQFKVRINTDEDSFVVKPPSLIPSDNDGVQGI